MRFLKHPNEEVLNLGHQFVGFKGLEILLCLGMIEIHDRVVLEDFELFVDIEKSISLHVGNFHPFNGPFGEGLLEEALVVVLQLLAGDPLMLMRCCISAIKTSWTVIKL